MRLLHMVNGPRRNTNAPTSGASYAGRQARLRLSVKGTDRGNILAFPAFCRKRSILYGQPKAQPGIILSIKTIDAVFDLTVGSSTDKLVLIALAKHADHDTGRCWPSLATLSEHTELTTRAINKSLKRLKAMGLITVIHRHRHSNIFTLNVVPATLNVVPARGEPGSRYPARRSLRTVKESSSEPSRNKSEDRLETAVEKIQSRAMMQIIRARQDRGQ